MKRFSGQDRKNRDAFVAGLADAWEAIEIAHGELEAAVEAINAKIAAYNELLGDADAWRSDIIARMEEYTCDRSEKWQESDTGQAYTEWLSEFENLDLTEVEDIELPAMPYASHIDDIDNLSEEPAS